LDQQLAHAVATGELVPRLPRGPQRGGQRGELLPVVLTDRLGPGLEEAVAAHEDGVPHAFDGAEFLVEQPAQAVGVCVSHGQCPSSCASCAGVASGSSGAGEGSSRRPRRVPSAQAAAMAGRPGSVGGGAAVRRAWAGAEARLRTVSPLAVVAAGAGPGAGAGSGRGSAAGAGTDGAAAAGASDSGVVSRFFGRTSMARVPW